MPLDWRRLCRHLSFLHKRTITGRMALRSRCEPPPPMARLAQRRNASAPFFRTRSAPLQGSLTSTSGEKRETPCRSGRGRCCNDFIRGALPLAGECSRMSECSTLFCKRGDRQQGHLHASGASHGFIKATPIGSKSATLRVTTVIPCVRAVAAISASSSGRGSGACKAAARRAIAKQIVRVRVANDVITLFSSHRRKIAPCLGSWRSIRRTPRSSSKIVTTEMKHDSTGALHDTRATRAGEAPTPHSSAGQGVQKARAKHGCGRA